MDEVVLGWKAALRILSEDVDAYEVTMALGLEPDKSVLRGSRLRTERLPPLPMPRYLWRLASRADPKAPLSEHIEWLLDRLGEPSRLRALAGRCDLELFCPITAERAPTEHSIRPDLIERLAEYGLALVLDVHPPLPGTPPAM